MNHFHAAGGIAFLVRTLLERGPAARRRADRRRATGCGATPPSPTLVDGDELTWEEGPKRSLDTDVLRPADDPFAPDGGLRMLDGQPRPRGHQDLRGEARAPAGRGARPGLRRPGRLPRRVRGRRARRRDFVAVRPLPGPGGQRHAGAAQADPAARRAAGPRPAGRARHRRPDVRRVGQGPGRHPRHARRPPSAGRSRGCATATWSRLDADAGTLEVHVDHAELAARPAGRARRTASSSGTGRELFAVLPRRRRPGRRGRQRLPDAPPRARRPVVQPSCPATSLPVIPVVVLDDLDQAVPLARALVAGGLPVIELTLRTPGRAGRDPRGSPPRCPRSWSARARSCPPGQAKRGARRGRAVPGLARAARPPCSPRWTTPGCRYLPGTSTVSEVLRRARARATPR